MKNVMILLRKDLLGLWRTKKVLILSLVFIIFALGSPLLAYYTPELVKLSTDPGLHLEVPKATIFDSYNQLYKNLGQVGVFAMLIIFAGEIVSERRKGQFTSLLNNGVNKTQFILSKIVSQMLLLTVVCIVSIGFFGLYNQILFNKAFASHSFLSFALLLVDFLFGIALVNFFSSFAKSMTVTMVLSFIVLLGLSISMAFKFGRYLPSNLSALAQNVLQNMSVTTAYQTMSITIGVTVVLSTLAVMFCRNKD